MARRSRMSVLKRQREVRKAEKAALKRERREQREGSTSQVATQEDLEAYGSEPASQQDEER
jgi:hypothetical protein